jgi:hypothetical protein
MPAPTAAELIERFTARYATCRSYEDTGEITTVFTFPFESIGRATRRMRYGTAFVSL